MYFSMITVVIDGEGGRVEMVVITYICARLRVWVDLTNILFIDDP